MRLPEITLSGTQDEVSPALQQQANAERNLGSTIEAGLTQYAQHVVQAQTIDAHLAATSKLNDLQDTLRTKKAFTADELQGLIGKDAYDALPDGIKNQPTITVPQLDASGKPVIDQMMGGPLTVDQQAPIPTHLIADTIWKTQAQKILDDAQQHITMGSGWQSQFQRAAAADVMQRWNQINTQQLAEAHQFEVDRVGRQVQKLANGGDFKTAELVIQMALPVLGEKGQMDLRGHLVGVQQIKPFDDTLRAFYTDPKSPQSLAALQQAMKDINDPQKTYAMDPQLKMRTARHLEVALGKAEGLGKAADIKQQGRDAMNEALKQAGNDPEKALGMLRTLPNVEVADEAEKRLRETISADDQTRKAIDSPHVATLESIIDRTGSLDRNSDEYRMLSKEGQARVEDKWKAAQRAARAEGSEERRLQNEHDRTALETFKGQPTKDQAGMDVDEVYRGVSPLGRATIKAEQKKAQAEWQKDQGVSKEAFTQQAVAIADAMHYQPKTPKRQKFIDAMEAERAAYLVAHPETRTLPPAEERRIFKSALDLYDQSWSISPVDDVKAAWELKVEGRTPNVPAKKQKGLEVLDRVLGPDNGGVAPAQAPGQTAAQQKPAAAAPVQIKSDADYNALPSGTQFKGPDGKLRRKP